MNESDWDNYDDYLDTPFPDYWDGSYVPRKEGQFGEWYEAAEFGVEWSPDDKSDVSFLWDNLISYIESSEPYYLESDIHPNK